MTRTLNSYTEQGLVENTKNIKRKRRSYRKPSFSYEQRANFLRRKKNQIAQSRMDPDSKRRAIDAIREAEQRRLKTLPLEKIVDG